MTFAMRPRVYIDIVALPFESPSGTDWIEITDWVQRLDFANGRSNGVSDFQPGSGRMILDNRDGRFDPTNTDGPYYPDLKLRRRVRVDGYVEDDGTPFGTFTFAYGYIEQLPQSWSFRYLVDTEVTWTDAFGLLANHDLPDSVWDYAIKQHCDAGRVVAWHRWGDTSSVAIDSSGNENHGRYVVSTGGVPPETDGTATPVAIIEAGKVASIVPQVNRPSLSFGKMVAETGQSVAASSLGWRFPSVVCHPATALWGTEFTVETWVLYKAGFALDSTGGPSASTPRPQWIALWGDPAGLASGVGLFANGTNTVQPDSDVALWNNTGGLISFFAQAAHFTIDVQVDDGLVHHLAYRTTDQTTYWQTEYFLDGVNVGNNTRLKSEFGAGFDRPMEIGRQFINRHAPTIVGAFASTLGDVVVYNEALTDQQIEDNYAAGYWGRLTGVGAATTGTAIDQALEMAGWQQFVSWDIGDKTVTIGKIADRTVTDFTREAARADGLLYQSRTGTIFYRDEGWQLNPLVGGPVRFSLADGDPTGLTTPVVGYEVCDFSYDDQLLANSWDVDWDGGTVHVEDAASIAEHGRYEQSVSTMLLESSAAQDLAAFRLWQYSSPIFRVGEVTFDALGGDGHIEAVCEYCDIGRRIRLVRTRPNGTTIDNEYHILGVRHQIEPANGLWDVSLSLELADSPGSPFIVGTSEVDGPDVLWY